MSTAAGTVEEREPDNVLTDPTLLVTGVTVEASRGDGFDGYMNGLSLDNRIFLAVQLFKSKITVIEQVKETASTTSYVNNFGSSKRSDAVVVVATTQRCQFFHRVFE